MTPQIGRWVLLATILASSMAFIDSTALNVALPAIQDDFQASGNDLLWITNAYTLFLASLILVGGALGDHFGRKRVFMIGIVLFAGTSFLCGIAPSIEFLIAARALQGIGGAIMVPGSLAIISASFGEKRGTAIGTWSAFTTMTTILGPLLGGELANAGLWRAVFFINIPLALIGIAVLILKIPEIQAENTERQPLDWAGAVLITLSLAALTYAFTELSVRGLTDGLILGAFGVGIIFFIGFIWWQKHTPNPMLPLNLFASETFTGTNLMTFFLYGALGGVLFFLPLNLIQIQGYNANTAGRAILPFALALVLISRRAGGWAERIGPHLPLTLGPGITGFGFALLALPGVTDGADTYFRTFFPAILLIGIGMGITVAPLSTAVMGSVAQSHAGIASGINNAVARTGGVLAVAILGTIAIVSFGQNMTRRAEVENLSDTTIEALNQEAEKLGKAEVSPSTPSNEQSTVKNVIAWAFVDTFRLLSFIGAGLAWLSAFLAWHSIRNEDVPSQAMPPPSSAAG